MGDRLDKNSVERYFNIVGDAHPFYIMTKNKNVYNYNKKRDRWMLEYNANKFLPSFFSKFEISVEEFRKYMLVEKLKK